MVRPIGMLLIDDGALTEEQLHRALVRQRELASRRRQARIGELVREMGFVSDDQLRRALDRQKRER